MKKKNSREFSALPLIDLKKYGGQQVAIVHGKVIAAGMNLPELIAEVKARMPMQPLQEVHIFSVPRTLTVVYYVS